MLKLSNIKLIVGLGNIGKQYENTRHNAGFIFLDHIFGEEGWSEHTRFQSLYKLHNKQEEKIHLIKPAKLMNRSGAAVQLLSSYYHIEPESILVAHDDLDIALGSSKLQFDKGPKAHNGIIDIEEKLGTSKFWRYRIGVDNRNEFQRQYMLPRDYVLERFTQSEYLKLVQSFTDFQM